MNEYLAGYWAAPTADEPPVRLVSVFQAARLKLGLDEVRTVILFPRDPEIWAEIVSTLAPGAVAVTYTPDPHPAVLINAAIRVALVFVVPLLVKVTLEVPEVYVHEPEVVVDAVIISVCPFPVMVSVLLVAGSVDRVPLTVAIVPEGPAFMVQRPPPGSGAAILGGIKGGRRGGRKGCAA